MDEIKYDILHQIHPALRKYITYIWTHGKTGVCSAAIQVLKISSSVNKEEEAVDTKYANKFTLSIPYAGHYLEWEVKFCKDDMTFAPDFDLGDDDFLGELNAESISKVLPSWSKWESKQPDALHKVLMELLQLYKKYQISLLEAKKFSRLHFEFTALIGGAGIGKDNIEVLIEPSSVVHFLIALSIDFSCLPPDIYKNKDSAGKNLGGPASAVLMVTFPRMDGSNVQPHLFISPAVEQSLLGVGNKHIPPFPSDGCLMDYVPAIQKLLHDKIKFVVDNYTFKKKYISMLLAAYPFNMLEYDKTNYSKAALVFETDVYTWLLTIVINNNFPNEKPRWTLKSIYALSEPVHQFSEPVMEILHDYPYSPRWTAKEMITRALKYAVEQIPQFQIKKK